MPLLAACLITREEYDPDGRLDDAKPPYAALRAVAEMFELPMAGEDEGILGEITYKTARSIFGELSVGDIVAS